MKGQGISGTAVPLASKKPLSSRPQPPKKADKKAPPPQTKTAVSKNVPPKVAKLPDIKTIREKALEQLALEAEPQRSGQVCCRWNHYRKCFPAHNGVVKFSDIDAEYSFSFVYRGNFTRKLKADGADDEDASAYVPGDGDFFIEVCPTRTYRLVVVEDPVAGVGAEGLRLKEGPIFGLKDAESVPKQSKAVELLTKELLKMDVSDLHSAQAKAIREARDVEDVLFSGSLL
jgi:hypothetical protein